MSAFTQPTNNPASATGDYFAWQNFESEQSSNQAIYHRRMDNAGYVPPTDEEMVDIRIGAERVREAAKSPETWAAWLEESRLRRECEALVAEI